MPSSKKLFLAKVELAELKKQSVDYRLRHVIKAINRRKNKSDYQWSGKLLNLESF